MAFGDGAATRAAYVAEVTPGTTPPSPTFKMMRVTRSGMRNSKQTAVSDERQPDRNVRDEMLLGVDAGGTYDFEMVYGSFDDILEAVTGGTWTSNVLVNGTVRRFFTFEETVELGATDSFQRYPMSMIDTFSLDITARRPITGNFSIFSQKKTLATAALASSTYSLPANRDVMTSGLSIAGITTAFVTPVPRIRRIQVAISNNARRRAEVGNLYSLEYGQGSLEVTGTIEAYFESNALYQAVLDHGIADIFFTMGHVTAEKYVVLMPRMRLLDGGAPTGGKNDDIIVNIPFRAIYDPSGPVLGSIKITRAVT